MRPQRIQRQYLRRKVRALRRHFRGRRLPLSGTTSEHLVVGAEALKDISAASTELKASLRHGDCNSAALILSEVAHRAGKASANLDWVRGDGAADPAAKDQATQATHNAIAAYSDAVKSFRKVCHRPIPARKASATPPVVRKK